jgi:hypothetical protein
MHHFHSNVNVVALEIFDLNPLLFFFCVLPLPELNVSPIVPIDAELETNLVLALANPEAHIMEVFKILLVEVEG